MNAFTPQSKIPVVILGATGCVGQKLILLLANHPWFEIIAVCASTQSVGKRYKDAVKWIDVSPLPSKIASMIIQPCQPIHQATLAFSALDSFVAKEIEKEFAEAGYLVVSNSSAYRMESYVPLLIGEVNSAHLELIKQQPFAKGKIITNPNCSVVGLSLALKPLLDQFGLEKVHIVTMQALSGAGYPGVSSLDIYDNLIPYIVDEETKIEQEPLKILGKFHSKLSTIQLADFSISAQCNRVNVSDGHFACVSVKFREKPTAEAIIEQWRHYRSLPQTLELPTAPIQPIHYFDEPFLPQPRLQRSLDKEMAVSIGRLRPCSLLDYKFCFLSHNRVRGAAGAAILNAEIALSLL